MVNCHSIVCCFIILGYLPPFQSNYCGNFVYNTEWWFYCGMTVNKIFITLASKTFIYCHSTVMPSFSVIKQYYDGNYHGMAVSNTMVIYRRISTLETTGIFITLAVNYHGIWTLEKVEVFTMVIYHGKLPQYFYNIGPWSNTCGRTSTGRIHNTSISL